MKTRKPKGWSKDHKRHVLAGLKGTKRTIKKVFRTKEKKIFLKKVKVPSNVKRMMQRKGINWVEIGICPDLSTIRGYYLDKENKLHQKTGSGWEFRPSEVYVKLTPEEEKSFCS